MDHTWFLSALFAFITVHYIIIANFCIFIINVFQLKYFSLIIMLVIYFTNYIVVDFSYRVIISVNWLSDIVGLLFVYVKHDDLICWFKPLHVLKVFLYIVQTNALFLSSFAIISLKIYAASSLSVVIIAILLQFFFLSVLIANSTFYSFWNWRYFYGACHLIKLYTVEKFTKLRVVNDFLMLLRCFKVRLTYYLYFQLTVG